MKTIARKFLAMVSALAVTGIMFVSLPVPAGAFPTETVYSSTNVGFGLHNDDDGVSAVPIGFNFDFYGTTYNNVMISTNGTIGFDGTDDDYSAVDLTVDAGLGDYLYPFWTDLETGSGSVSYTTLGTAPNRMFVVQWTDMVLNYTSSYDLPLITFQSIMYEGTNVVKFQYRYTLHGADPLSDPFAIGIGNGTVGENVQYIYDGPGAMPVTDGQAIRFTPDGGGGYTMDSAAAYDPIYLQATDIPGASSFVYPLNNAFDVPVTPVLEWSPVAGADWYNVYLSSDPAFPFINSNPDSTKVIVDEEGITGTTFDTASTPLELNTRYYWFVQSGSDEGSTMTSFGTFFTGADPNPVTPEPTLPYTGR